MPTAPLCTLSVAVNHLTCTRGTCSLLPFTSAVKTSLIWANQSSPSSSLQQRKLRLRTLHGCPVAAGPCHQQPSPLPAAHKLHEKLLTWHPLQAQKALLDGQPHVTVSGTRVDYLSSVPGSPQLMLLSCWSSSRSSSTCPGLWRCFWQGTQRQILTILRPRSWRICYSCPTTW